MQERQLSLYFHYVVISPEAPCWLDNFDTLRHILVMFGRNEEEGQ